MGREQPTPPRSSHILAASLGRGAGASAEAGLGAVDQVGDEGEDEEEDDDDEEDDDVALHLGEVLLWLWMGFFLCLGCW